MTTPSKEIIKELELKVDNIREAIIETFVAKLHNQGNRQLNDADDEFKSHSIKLDYNEQRHCRQINDNYSLRYIVRLMTSVHVAQRLSQ